VSRLRRIILAATLLAALSVPGSALAKAVTVSSGGVTAELTYTPGKFSMDSDVAMRITQGSSLLSSGAAAGQCGKSCQVVPNPVSVVNLEPGQPDVVLEVSSGGAHCCFSDLVYSPASSGHSYKQTDYDFGNAGDKLVDLNNDGLMEFETADNSFAYRFSDYAESAMPIEVLSYAKHQFTNVTRRYPALIAQDAKLWWGYYVKDHDSGRVGLIAAWAADEWNLGQRAHAYRVLSGEIGKSHIGLKFVNQLTNFLIHHGYANPGN
jgi:hypothetical protein